VLLIGAAGDLGCKRPRGQQARRVLLLPLVGLLASARPIALAQVRASASSSLFFVFVFLSLSCVWSSSSEKLARLT